jgi:cytochrome P450
MTLPSRRTAVSNPSLSLGERLQPEYLANPYPLYERLRTEAPVHWDPYLHAWVVTRYADVVTILQRFSAERLPTPEQLEVLGLSELTPIAQVIVRQMIFMDPPEHTRLRSLCAAAFTPAKAERLRLHIQEITDRLLDAALPNGRMDVIADLANSLPAIVTAEMMGVPVADAENLKNWSTDFSEILGNFQHNPGRTAVMLNAVEAMTAFYRDMIREQTRSPRPGVLNALMTAEIEGDRLSEEEIIANAIITTVGGQETTTNLIANGLLSLLRNPAEMDRLRAQPGLVPGAVEEFLRFESPIQHTGRLAPENIMLHGQQIRKRQAVIAVLGAANHDPERFPDPEVLNITRDDNRHLAFGWAAHYCFGAPLARVEAQIVFSTLLRKLNHITLDSNALIWRNNVAFRGLEALHVHFEAHDGE